MSSESIDKTPRGKVFTIWNNHVGECNSPPDLSNANNKNYYGYYENQYGEQFVFVLNRKTGQASVYCGDADWGKAWPVVSEDVDVIVSHIVREAQAKREKADPKDVRRYLVSDLPEAKAHVLPNGHYLLAVGLVMSQDEVEWLRGCWLPAHPDTFST